MDYIETTDNPNKIDFLNYIKLNKIRKCYEEYFIQQNEIDIKSYKILNKKNKKYKIDESTEYNTINKYKRIIKINKNNNKHINITSKWRGSIGNMKVTDISMNLIENGKDGYIFNIINSYIDKDNKNNNKHKISQVCMSRKELEILRDSINKMLEERK